MKKLHVAVIGCGSIAKHRHLPEYASNPHVKLVAVCDKVKERAEEYAKLYHCKAYTDWREVVALHGVDVVSVCTPNALHAPISIAALQAGKHVLCEKPMAISPEETAAMVAASHESGKVLMIGHNQRLAPLHVRAKQILQSGILGRVLTFRTSFAHPGPEGWSVEGKGGWFFQKDQAFVGAMGDLGVHKADLIRWMLDDEVVEVAAYVDAIANKANSTVDDNAVCLFRMASGAMGTMVASWSHAPGGDNSTVLFGEKGIMRIDCDPAYNVVVELANGEKQYYKTGALQTNEAGGQTSSGVIATFVDCIINKTPCPIPGEEGAKSMAVIFACLESSEMKRFVPVSGVAVS
ncbi:MAG TPA: Gfo/Idh/MocA family oxidoreductase [Armatimonadota bacterium]|jgi:predicted dehydrogenase